MTRLSPPEEEAAAVADVRSICSVDEETIVGTTVDSEDLEVVACDIVVAVFDLVAEVCSCVAFSVETAFATMDELYTDVVAAKEEDESEDWLAEVWRVVGTATEVVVLVPEATWADSRIEDEDRADVEEGVGTTSDEVVIVVATLELDTVANVV